MRQKGTPWSTSTKAKAPPPESPPRPSTLLHQYTGRGPTKARTTLDGNLVAILLADTLTTGERTLVEHGRADRVMQLRHDYQNTMRDDLTAIVERELNREVIAFMSQNHINPDLAVEVFVLKPTDTAREPSNADA